MNLEVRLICGEETKEGAFPVGSIVAQVLRKFGVELDMREGTYLVGKDRHYYYDDGDPLQTDDIVDGVVTIKVCTEDPDETDHEREH